MSDTYHHGVSVGESTDLSTIITDIQSAVIGVVCTADDADASTFPLNEPVLLTRVAKVLGKAGKTGTLYKTLKAISDQTSPYTIVVRVADASNISAANGETAPTQDQLVIGGTDANGRYTGLYALLTAEARVGYRPRILGVPDLDSQPVTAQLVVIAEKLRAFAYAAAYNCSTMADAVAYRKNFSQRELMILWPDWIAYNSHSGSNETAPAVAYALGLRAKLDEEQGWHKVLSNVAVDNVLGISKDVYFSLQSIDSDADYLNSNAVTTLIKQNGFRFWGSRTCDTETYIFESYTRTAQILADTVAEAHFSYIDKPLTPSLAKDTIDGINKKLSALVTAGKLLGAKCWYETDANTSETLRTGKLTIKYNYSPVPPLEHLDLVQEFTDEYYATFANTFGG
ncbi:phage tail sheath subtilisin-like domain-containing protein [Musicola keenii]|uniref:phage tail sheath subtilisin-like domain-containing protein n=1 Tax=Musicola keenii TaxID=2884250 RepID=UPI001782A6D1|nr:phage tail sheath subtilisin-like domain-containing protein [Musicola keenii]